MKHWGASRACPAAVRPIYRGQQRVRERSGARLPDRWATAMGDADRAAQIGQSAASTVCSNRSSDEAWATKISPFDSSVTEAGKSNESTTIS